MDDVLRKIHWLGHDGFRLELGGRQVYIDPYKIGDGLPVADLILVTHEHYDHCSPEDIDKISGPETVILTEPKSAKKLGANARTMAPGDETEVAGIVVRAVASYNLDKKFHPRKNAWIGFVIEADGTSIYHAGDSDHIPEMKDITADVALLPVSGTYVMTADEAVAAAREIAPKLAIPMHYGTLVGEEADAAAFARGLENSGIRVEILTPEGGAA